MGCTISNSAAQQADPERAPGVSVTGKTLYTPFLLGILRGGASRYYLRRVIVT